MTKISGQNYLLKLHFDKDIPKDSLALYFTTDLTNGQLLEEELAIENSLVFFLSAESAKSQDARINELLIYLINFLIFAVIFAAYRWPIKTL